nr:hypothetical protein [Tanacetum cinerariifolium]
MSIYDYMTLPSWSYAKVVEESHNLSSCLLDRVSSHTTAPAVEGAMISLPTTDEINASLPDPHLAKKSKGISQARVHSSSNNALEPSQQLKKRKPGKRASEPGSSAQELGQSEEIGCSSPVADVSASRPSPVGTSFHAFTSRCNLYLGGAIASGHVGKSRAEEEWDGPHVPESNILCMDIFKDPDMCRKALDQTITPAELRMTESLLPLELLNRINRDAASEKVKRLQSQLTDAKAAFVGAKDDFDKALVGFPTTQFPFLGKVAAAAGGMTASVPYAGLNSVSPLLILGVVLMLRLALSKTLSA